MPDDLESRFSTFFQAFWLKPVEGLSDRLIGFHGEAQKFSVVIRAASSGTPLATFLAELVNGAVQLDLAEWMPGADSVTLALFGNADQAKQYFAESEAGWTAAEQKVIDDPALLQMIPDVRFAPQEEVRAARDQCDPQNPESVELMNAALLLIYPRFAAFDGKVVPEVALPGIKGLLIGAAGNPPEWVPPG